MSDKSVAPGRKQYLGNPAFQLRFVGLMAGIALLAVSALYVSNVLFMAKFVALGEELHLPAEHPFWRFIAEQKHVLNSTFLVTSTVVGAVIMVGGILLSHRIAGPIHRMQSHLDEISETGEVRELTFRQGDFFPEMAESINSTLGRLTNVGASARKFDRTGS